jgi:hypothetical protein
MVECGIKATIEAKNNTKNGYCIDLMTYDFYTITIAVTILKGKGKIEKGILM